MDIGAEIGSMYSPSVTAEQEKFLTKNPLCYTRYLLGWGRGFKCKLTMDNFDFGRQHLKPPSPPEFKLFMEKLGSVETTLYTGKLPSRCR